jgi:gamma-glutamylputrescine oxidase
VQQLVPERRIVARTAAGEVRADSVVLATNAYMSGMELPKAIASALLPIYVQLFRTEPLGQEQLRRVDWHGREGIYTAHEILESFRLDADNAIVGGSKYIRYGYGGGFLPDRDSSVALRLEGLFRRRFPELADVRVTRHWGGRIGMALDFLPVVGRTGPADNIYYAMGWAGHGVATATFAGRMIAALMHGERGPGDVLVDRRFWSLPPEPLRWFVFQALSRFFSAVDRRADRELG